MLFREAAWPEIFVNNNRFRERQERKWPTSKSREMPRSASLLALDVGRSKIINAFVGAITVSKGRGIRSSRHAGAFLLLTGRRRAELAARAAPKTSSGSICHFFARERKWWLGGGEAVTHHQCYLMLAMPTKCSIGVRRVAAV